MAEKEYIISLKRGVDYEAFDNEMQEGIGRGLIKDRMVEVANARPLSQRNTHYILEEAEVTEIMSPQPSAQANTNLSFDELRARLPQEITDDIVVILAESPQALVEFADIQTQADVDAFNAKYGVNLVLPTGA